MGKNKSKVKSEKSKVKSGREAIAVPRRCWEGNILGEGDSEW
jgi:hypothetical protein